MTIGHGLAGSAAAISGISIKFNSILMRLPLRIQHYCAPFDRCQVYNALAVCIADSTSIGIAVPTGKGVARSGVGIGGQIDCNVKSHWLVTHATTVCVVSLIFDSVVVGAPLGVQGYFFPFGGRQVYNIFSIGINGSAAILLGIPTGKGIAGFGIAVRCQVGRLIIGHGLAGCTAAISRISVKFYGIPMRIPNGVKGIIICIYCSDIICRIRMTGAVILGIP